MQSEEIQGEAVKVVDQRLRLLLDLLQSIVTFQGGGIGARTKEERHVMSENFARDENTRQQPEQLPNTCFDSRVGAECQLFDQLTVQFFFQGFLDMRSNDGVMPLR